MTTDNSTCRKRVRRFIIRGLASPSEIADASGVSKQLIGYWIRDIDWRKARKTMLDRLWEPKRKP
jgi:hypothetical protein